MKNEPARKRLKKYEEEHARHLAHDESNWLVSYADLMTLLFGFFVLMFALSRFDENKFELVRKDIASKFSDLEIKDSVTSQEKQKLEDLLISILAEYGDAKKIETLVKRDLAKDPTLSADPVTSSASDPANPSEEQEVTGNDFSVTISKENEIELKLSEKVTFAPGSSTLTPESKNLLEKIGAQIKTLPIELVSIEGHTDDSPLSSIYFPSNWELSTARAGAVVRSMITSGIQSDKLKAVGFAETRPLAPNRNENGELIRENQALNRRVIIRIAMDRSEKQKLVASNLKFEEGEKPKKEEQKDPKTLTLEEQLRKKQEDLQAAQDRLKEAKENQRKLRERQKLRLKLQQLEKKINQVDEKAKKLNPTD